MYNGLAIAVIGSVLWLGSVQSPTRSLPPRASLPIQERCKGCGPGEALAEVTISLGPGDYVSSHNPPCGNPRFDNARLPADMKESARAQYRRIGVYAMGLTDSPGRPPGSSGAVSQLIKPGANRSNCGRLLIVMPKTARITRILKEPLCPAGGWCGFGYEPTTEEIDSDLLGVSVVFKNWSHNQGASATLRVYYRR